MERTGQAEARRLNRDRGRPLPPAGAGSAALNLADKQGDRNDRPLLLAHAERPQDHDVPGGSRDWTTGSSRSTSAPAISSSPTFLAISPEQPHAGDRRLPRRPTAASRSACSSPARSCCISPRRPANSCRRTCAAARPSTEWLIWQVAGLGPMAGQNHHFGLYAPEKIPYAIDRYVKETNRLYGVLDRRSRRPRRSSPATITRSPTWLPIRGSFPGSASSRIWTTSRTCGAGSTRCAQRPGTQRAYARGEPYSSRPTVTEEGKKILFGQTASRASAA